MKYLQYIHSPDDLKGLDEQALEALAEEIRQALISAVSKNGGHLASNLGVVELTIALHRVFSSPHDQLVFDVGHQCYTHKLLTGRYGGFDSIRTENGLSGFPKPYESEHDIFATGHSGTSVSASLGLASAKLLDSDKGYAVAVIGDGSFGNGMVYEALNNAGRTKNRQIVILNDNHMSISENVGMLSKQLAVLRTRPEYFFLKAAAERAINRIPLVGEGLASELFKLKTDIKNKLYDKSNFFEQLGYRYMGPIDGHNITQLCDALEGAKRINGPVLLHVNTLKGKGYDFAEHAPSRYHGISAFNIVSGEPVYSSKSYSDVFGAFICSAAERDRRVCAVTAAMSIGTGLSEYSLRFQNRFFDVGIAEEHATAFCAGLAKNGKLPVFAVYSTFLQRCYDQLTHDVALQGVHVVFAVDRAGFVGEDGETHQGLMDAAFLNTIPGIRVYSPCTFRQLLDDLERALFKDGGAVAVRYPRGAENTLALCADTSGDWFEYGDADAATVIVSYGRVCSAAQQAVCELHKKGMSVKLVGLNLIKPIPEGAVLSVMKSGRVLFFEEGVRSGGVGSLFALRLMESGYKGTFSLTAVEDRYVAQASVETLLKNAGLDAESIMERAQACD